MSPQLINLVDNYVETAHKKSEEIRSSLVPLASTNSCSASTRTNGVTLRHHQSVAAADSPAVGASAARPIFLSDDEDDNGDVIVVVGPATSSDKTSGPGAVSSSHLERAPRHPARQDHTLESSSISASSSQSHNNNLSTTRCNSCVGCKRAPCEECAICQQRNDGECAFRPCESFASQLLYSYRSMARKLVERGTDEDAIAVVSWSRLYNKLYGSCHEAAAAVDFDDGNTMHVETSDWMQGPAWNDVDLPSTIQHVAESDDDAKMPARTDETVNARASTKISLPSSISSVSSGESNQHESSARPGHTYHDTTTSSTKKGRVGGNYNIHSKDDDSASESDSDTNGSEHYQQETNLDTSNNMKSKPAKTKEPADRPVPGATSNSLNFLRCRDCIGCRQRSCGMCEWCQGKAVLFKTCVFRPCSNFKRPILENLRDRAVLVIQQDPLPSGFRARFNCFYGKKGRFVRSLEKAETPKTESMVPMKQELTGKRSRQTTRKRLVPMKQEPTGQRSRQTARKRLARVKSEGKVGSKVAEKLKPNTVEKGTRVYCLWPKNDRWYWGKISAVGKHTEKYGTRYTVKFDDGDVRYNVIGSQFVTEAEYFEDENMSESAEASRRGKRKVQSAGDRDTKRRCVDDVSNGLKKESIRKQAPHAENVSCGRSLRIGSRCYAKWKDGTWHWGKVTGFSGAGERKSYDVLFDDGDTITSVPSLDIASENDYLRQQRHFDRSELRRRRCGTCALCAKKDCGKCQTCVKNCGLSTVFKEVCLRKLCMELPVREKQQCLWGKLDSFSFYFVEPSSLSTSLRKSPPFLLELEGLVIVNEDGTQFRTLSEACRGRRLKESELVEQERDLYVNTLGASVNVEVDHHLVGRRYYHSWIDHAGTHKGVFGTFMRCRRNAITKHLLFSVKLDECCRELQIPGVLHQEIPVVLEDIEENDAWGGYVAHGKWSDNISVLNEPELPDFYRMYIAPKYRKREGLTEDGVALYTFIVCDHRFRLWASKSGIKDAGLGLWVSCRRLGTSSTKGFFTLPAGTLIDLGVYAPLTEHDFEKNCVSLLKNFVHGYSCENWQYESGKPLGDGVYDITDDTTGELHDSARRNPVIFANETDGTTAATITGQHDPEGSVHYYLGHALADQGPFRIPANGKPVEVKIDYGPDYETVRIRKGYSRLSGRKLQESKKQVDNNEFETVQTFKELPLGDVQDCVTFLKKVFVGFAATDEKKIHMVGRALVASLVFRERVRYLERVADTLGDDSDDKSVCTDVVTCLAEGGIAGDISDVIRYLCQLYPGGNEQIRDCLLSSRERVYKTVLIECLQLQDGRQLSSLGAGELVETIQRAK